MTPPRTTMGTAYILEPAPAPASVTIAPEEKMAAALTRYLGVTPEALQRVCESFSPRVNARLLNENRGVLAALRTDPGLVAPSLPWAYELLTGDSPPYGQHARVRETLVQNTFANTLGNAFGRRLLVDFVAEDYGEASISRAGAARDFRGQRIVAVDELADVPSVDAEVANYTEAPAVTERTISFSVEQRGYIITISRRVILNDDVQLVTRILSSVGRAARRTLAKRVWNPWITNATYPPDGLPWFHPSHGNNLLSNALSASDVKVAIDRLLAMTQPGSGEKLGLRLRPGTLWLMVPNQLWSTAFQINQTVSDGLYHVFGEDNQFILVNPLLSDVNDWGVHRGDIESIRVDYLHGREDPEFLLSDARNAGNMFLGDRLQYKLRHEYGIQLAEWRGATKSQA